MDETPAETRRTFMSAVWRNAWFNIFWKAIGILIAYLLAERYWPD